MSALAVLQTYFYYLIHPFKTHQALKSGEAASSGILALSVYESLGASWVFIVISGMLRIVLINGLILLFVDMLEPASGLISKFYDGDKFAGFYFVILTTILDVIFFPLITLFVIQFWEFVLKAFARLAGAAGDVEGKIASILSVSLSSHILQVVPVFGDMAQKAALFAQMYAGIREQLEFSRSLTLCVLFTPVLVLLFLATLIMLLALI